MLDPSLPFFFTKNAMIGGVSFSSMASDVEWRLQVAKRPSKTLNSSQVLALSLLFPEKIRSAHKSIDNGKHQTSYLAC